MGPAVAFCHLKSVPALDTPSLSLTYVLPARCLSLSLHSKVVKAGGPAEAANWYGQVSPFPLSHCGPTSGHSMGAPRGGWSAQACIETSPPENFRTNCG